MIYILKLFSRILFPTYEIRISQHLHYWHSALESSLLWGRAIMPIVGCLASPTIYHGESSSATKNVFRHWWRPLVLNFKIWEFFGDGKKEEERLFLRLRKKGIRKAGNEENKKVQLQLIPRYKEKVLFCLRLTENMLIKHCCIDPIR